MERLIEWEWERERRRALSYTFTEHTLPASLPFPSLWCITLTPPTPSLVRPRGGVVSRSGIPLSLFPLVSDVSLILTISRSLHCALWMGDHDHDACADLRRRVVVVVDVVTIVDQFWKIDRRGTIAGGIPVFFFFYYIETLCRTQTVFLKLVLPYSRRLDKSAAGTWKLRRRRSWLSSCLFVYFNACQKMWRKTFKLSEKISTLITKDYKQVSE